MHFQEKSRMEKDTPTLHEKSESGPQRSAAAGQTRQFHYAPHACRSKADACSLSRTVVLAALSENTGGLGAACVRQLAEAGHRVVTILSDQSMAHTLADAIATGRVVTLPIKTLDVAGFESAIKSLPSPFRAPDAVVSITHLPQGRIALLGAGAALTDMSLPGDAGRSFAAVRAALPGLLASTRGHVVKVTLAAQPGKAITTSIFNDALCAALRYELDEMGIRFTHIKAGPVEGQADARHQETNRPRSNGVQRGMLFPAEIAQAVAWTLSQPDHVAVRDIELGPAPYSQPALSPREREVLEWTACGKTAEEISCILGLSVSAINFHVRSLLAKLQCCNKTAAVARAALLGLLI
jgi:NADP-dependent 3-hydroxy acid dehydrogenase YdfG